MLITLCKFQDYNIIQYLYTLLCAHHWKSGFSLLFYLWPPPPAQTLLWQSPFCGLSKWSQTEKDKSCMISVIKQQQKQQKSSMVKQTHRSRQRNVSSFKCRQILKAFFVCVASTFLFWAEWRNLPPHLVLIQNSPKCRTFHCFRCFSLCAGQVHLNVSRNCGQTLPFRWNVFFPKLYPCIALHAHTCCVEAGAVGGVALLRVHLWPFHSFQQDSKR